MRETLNENDVFYTYKKKMPNSQLGIDKYSIIDIYRNTSLLKEITSIEMFCDNDNHYKLELIKESGDKILFSNGIASGNGILDKESAVTFYIIKACEFYVTEDFIISNKQFVIKSRFDLLQNEFSKIEVDASILQEIKNNISSFVLYQPSKGEALIDSVYIKLHDAIADYDDFNTHSSLYDVMASGKIGNDEKGIYIISSAENKTGKTYSYVFRYEKDDYNFTGYKYLGRTEVCNIFPNFK